MKSVTALIIPLIVCLCMVPLYEKTTPFTRRNNAIMAPSFSLALRLLLIPPRVSIKNPVWDVSAAFCPDQSLADANAPLTIVTASCSMLRRCPSPRKLSA
jgi:hypothetical protein